MSAIDGTNIVVGITGGIAAYKSVELTRRLRDEGADVRVVVTPAGKAFITPLTLQATSGNPVHDSLLDASAEAGMGHIELARWADQIIVAPASADFIARLATGLADTLLSTLCLASEAPITIADIAKIKETFIKILISQHHKRIRYPKQDEMENDNNESES